ncbi:hypothetical protein [Methylorubrum suomiense]|uniref:Uncharacterized protein n=1 Tax=Methylorubrum suomiense TaxID=144191 RepID=A0ABQ4URL3_9HYPH|nr:hypothetical protein [Methylorubrum suomiense]GJE74958.1 hypothetical protein BGCPKDLD_1532 [Methylorubrum suomiense]
MAADSWTRWGLRAAERCLSNAEGNVRRAEERLGRPAPARFFALAWDEAIRASALEACRYISGLDADWAAERNARGWSQATTWTGHILSERAVLTRAEAAHALALLHQHRRQLSHDANVVLFGEPLAPRRRADPEQAALGF